MIDIDLHACMRANQDTIAAITQTVAELREYEDDNRRLVRDLDVIWNGTRGAAKQASLCDLVSQIGKEVADLRSDIDRHISIASQLATEVEELRAERERLTEVFSARQAMFGESYGFGYRLTVVFQNREIADAAFSLIAALASPPAAEEPATKGCYGAECNRASCHNVPATWKHRDIPRHYCQPCGMWINENNSDCDPPLCGPAPGDAT